MKFFNVIRSYFLMLKASALQGRGRFEEVVEIATLARELHPKSQMAFMLLYDDLTRLHRTDEVKALLEEALHFHPKDHLFNIFYAQLLEKERSSLEEIVPYVKTYIKEKPPPKSSFPFYMKIFVNSDRLANLEKSINVVSNEHDLWAEKIIRSDLETESAT